MRRSEKCFERKVYRLQIDWDYIDILNEVNTQNILPLDQISKIGSIVTIRFGNLKEILQMIAFR